jgi:hypothetical protein
VLEFPVDHVDDRNDSDRDALRLSPWRAHLEFELPGSPDIRRHRRLLRIANEAIDGTIPFSFFDDGRLCMTFPVRDDSFDSQAFVEASAAKVAAAIAGPGASPPYHAAIEYSRDIAARFGRGRATPEQSATPLQLVGPPSS